MVLDSAIHGLLSESVDGITSHTVPRKRADRSHSTITSPYVSSENSTTFPQ